jgi:hypothetical protein
MMKDDIMQDYLVLDCLVLDTGGLIPWNLDMDDMVPGNCEESISRWELLGLD